MASIYEELNKKMADVKRPAVVPPGLYYAVITGVPAQAEPLNSDKGSFEKMTFQLKLKGAFDVNEAMLEDFQADEGIIAGTPIRQDFIFNVGDDAEAANARKRTVANLRDFLTKAGVDESLSVFEGIASAAGHEVIVQVKHRRGDNEGDVFLELAKVSSLP